MSCELRGNTDGSRGLHVVLKGEQAFPKWSCMQPDAHRLRCRHMGRPPGLGTFRCLT